MIMCKIKNNAAQSIKKKSKKFSINFIHADNKSINIQKVDDKIDSTYCAVQYVRTEVHFE